MKFSIFFFQGAETAKLGHVKPHPKKGVRCYEFCIIEPTCANAWWLLCMAFCLFV